MKKILFFVPLVLVILVGCERSEGPTQPSMRANAGNPQGLQKASAVDFGGGMIVYNPCCNEWVLTQCEGKIVFRDNGMHITATSATGTGYNGFPFDDGSSPTGNTYTQQGAATTSFTQQEDGTWTGTFKIHLVNQNGCGFFLKQTYHVTVNANGEVKAELTKEDVTCE